jgi:hypothetical protein
LRRISDGNAGDTELLPGTEVEDDTLEMGLATRGHRLTLGENQMDQKEPKIVRGQINYFFPFYKIFSILFSNYFASLKLF